MNVGNFTRILAALVMLVGRSLRIVAYIQYVCDEDNAPFSGEDNGVNAMLINAIDFRQKTTI